MSLYLVELTGECREIYAVEADSEDDARANWMHGTLELSEAYGMEVDSVKADDYV